MAVPYPAGLPLGLRQGRSYNLVQTFKRSELTNGRAIQRRSFADVPVGVQVNWLFTSAQVLLFENWYRYKISDGAAWFDIILDHPLGKEPYTCRFTRVYTGPAHAGPGLWTVSAELEMRSRPTAPEEFTEFPEYLLDAGIFDTAVNVYLPEVN